MPARTRRTQALFRRGLPYVPRPTCALVLLYVVQGCERFAFTAILPLFVLYLHHRHGLAEPTALLVLGLFNALSYVGGLPGGMLSDRNLAQRRGCFGAALLTLGNALLASDSVLLLAGAGCVDRGPQPVPTQHDDDDRCRIHR